MENTFELAEENVDDQRLGTISVYIETKSNRLFFLRILQAATIEEFKAHKQVFVDRNSQKNSNFLELHSCSVSEPTLSCQVILEYPSEDIYEIRKELKSEEFLRFFVTQVYSTLIALQRSNPILVDIRPDHFWFDKTNRRVVLVDNLREYSSSYNRQSQRAKEGKNIYLSPQQFEALGDREVFLSLEGLNSRIFSLGLTLIAVIYSDQYVKQFYNFEELTFDRVKFFGLLETLRMDPELTETMKVIIERVLLSANQNAIDIEFIHGYLMGPSDPKQRTTQTLEPISELSAEQLSQTLQFSLRDNGPIKHGSRKMEEGSSNNLNGSSLSGSAVQGAQEAAGADINHSFRKERNRDTGLDQENNAQAQAVPTEPNVFKPGSHDSLNEGSAKSLENPGLLPKAKINLDFDHVTASARQNELVSQYKDEESFDKAQGRFSRGGSQTIMPSPLVDQGGFSVNVEASRIEPLRGGSSKVNAVGAEGAGISGKVELQGITDSGTGIGEREMGSLGRWSAGESGIFGGNLAPAKVEGFSALLIPKPQSRLEISSIRDLADSTAYAPPVEIETEKPGATIDDAEEPEEREFNNDPVLFSGKLDLPVVPPPQPSQSIRRTSDDFFVSDVKSNRDVSASADLTQRRSWVRGSLEVPAHGDYFSSPPKQITDADRYASIQLAPEEAARIAELIHSGRILAPLPVQVKQNIGSSETPLPPPPESPARLPMSGGPETDVNDPNFIKDPTHFKGSLDLPLPDETPVIRVTPPPHSDTSDPMFFDLASQKEVDKNPSPHPGLSQPLIPSGQNLRVTTLESSQRGIEGSVPASQNINFDFFNSSRRDGGGVANNSSHNSNYFQSSHHDNQVPSSTHSQNSQNNFFASSNRSDRNPLDNHQQITQNSDLRASYDLSTDKNIGLRLDPPTDLHPTSTDHQNANISMQIDHEAKPPSSQSIKIVEEFQQKIIHNDPNYPDVNIYSSLQSDNIVPPHQASSNFNINIPNSEIVQPTSGFSSTNPTTNSNQNINTNANNYMTANSCLNSNSDSNFATNNNLNFNTNVNSNAISNSNTNLNTFSNTNVNINAFTDTNTHTVVNTFTNTDTHTDTNIHHQTDTLTLIDTKMDTQSNANLQQKIVNETPTPSLPTPANIPIIHQPMASSEENVQIGGKQIPLKPPSNKMINLRSRLSSQSNISDRFPSDQNINMAGNQVKPNPPLFSDPCLSPLIPPAKTIDFGINYLSSDAYIQPPPPLTPVPPPTPGISHSPLPPPLPAPVSDISNSPINSQVPTLPPPNPSPTPIPSSHSRTQTTTTTTITQRTTFENNIPPHNLGPADVSIYSPLPQPQNLQNAALHSPLSSSGQQISPSIRVEQIEPKPPAPAAIRRGSADGSIHEALQSSQIDKKPPIPFRSTLDQRASETTINHQTFVNRQIAENQVRPVPSRPSSQPAPAPKGIDADLRGEITKPAIQPPLAVADSNANLSKRVVVPSKGPMGQSDIPLKERDPAGFPWRVAQNATGRTTTTTTTTRNDEFADFTSRTVRYSYTTAGANEDRSRSRKRIVLDRVHIANNSLVVPYKEIVDNRACTELKVETFPLPHEHLPAPNPTFITPSNVSAAYTGFGGTRVTTLGVLKDSRPPSPNFAPIITTTKHETTIVQRVPVASTITTQTVTTQNQSTETRTFISPTSISTNEVFTSIPPRSVINPRPVSPVYISPQPVSPIYISSRPVSPVYISSRPVQEQRGWPQNTRPISPPPLPVNSAGQERLRAAPCRGSLQRGDNFVRLNSLSSNLGQTSDISSPRSPLDRPQTFNFGPNACNSPSNADSSQTINTVITSKTLPFKAFSNFRAQQERPIQLLPIKSGSSNSQNTQSERVALPIEDPSRGSLTPSKRFHLVQPWNKVVEDVKLHSEVHSPSGISTPERILSLNK